MDHDKKLAFLQGMTQLALTHAASVPNAPTPTGKMSHDKMMSFVQNMAKTGIQHFDVGGSALAGAYTGLQAGTPTSFGGNSNTSTSLSGPSTTGQANNVSSGSIGGLLGNILGTNNGFQASGAAIQSGTNVNQLNNSYQGVQGALGAQNNLVGQTASGVNQGLSNQSALADQLAAEANGQGPNPAQAALNQSTGQNIAQQAALAAGQRGGSANVGLLARQNAQQGAATQQQAVGQSATLQAQQQLAAQNAQANLAATQVGQGATAVQNLNQQQQNEQNILQGANTSFNNANVSQQANINNVNAGVSEANQNSSSSILGSVFNGASSLLSKVLNKGGEVKKMADGGSVAPGDDTPTWQSTSSDVSSGPSVPASAAPPQPQSSSSGGSGGGGGGIMGLLALLSKGGDVKAHYTNYFAGKPTNNALMSVGGKVGASGNEKAVVSGDSLKNDKVPALLSQGEIVIPRHITMGPNAPAKAAAFVAAELKKRGAQK